MSAVLNARSAEYLFTQEVLGAKFVHAPSIAIGTSQTDAKLSSARFVMEDAFDKAVDMILAEAGGDVRRALRAVLIENFQLESELRQLYTVSVYGKPASKQSLH